MSAEQAGTNEQQTALVGDGLQPVSHLAETGESHKSDVQASPGKEDDAAPEVVIWTPGFMLAFAFLLVAGLSLESLLTQGWLNRYYSGQWVFQGHVLLVGMAWLALMARARSRRVRVGAGFGLLWAVFLTVNILVQVVPGNASLELQANVNVLICLSWLGCTICLTIERPLSSRWDAWLLGLLPLIGVLACALLFLLARDYSLIALESSIATVSLALSAIAWLARPSCWRGSPGLCVLFGLVPVILFGLDLANNGYNTVNFFLARVVLYAQNTVTIREANFFFSQVVLLCLLLGAIRLLKCELAN